MIQFEFYKMACKCPDCGDSHEMEGMVRPGEPQMQNEAILCPRCLAEWERSEIKRKRSEIQAERMKQIPAEYREAEVSLVKPCYARALTEFPLRLGFMGPSGSGKTSAMACHLIRRNVPFQWLTGNVLREITLKAAMDPQNGASALRGIKHTSLLAIDDISQPRFTEAFASALFDILEQRNSDRLPVIWTSQKSLPDLRSKIADQCGDQDQADAISRRLIQDGLKLEYA